MLQAANLTCQRGDRILFSHLDFSAETGELVHVAGPNGSGKTSLLRILCGLSSPIEGSVHWHAHPARGEEFHAALLYLGHHNAVKDELSALENLRISFELSGLALDEHQALDALARIGLAGREWLPAKVLSQGQKRRVSLARLLVSRAPLWILDEPLTALDVAAVKLIEARLAEHLNTGGTVIYTTHQPVDVPGHTARRLELGQP